MKLSIPATLLGLALLAGPAAEAGTALSHIGALKTELENRLDALPDDLSREQVKEARWLARALSTIDRDFPRCPDVVNGGARAAKLVEKFYRAEIADRGTMFDLLDGMCGTFDTEINEDYAAAEALLEEETDPKVRHRARKALDKATSFLEKSTRARTFSKRCKMQSKAFRSVEKAERFLD